ncbi:GNAT family N-acetyltransferase [Polaromonas sp.]|uniref:GNAT family N-acetyltransferase n=1 Tax=Polaromonas sp. TaxID=1869339 RepID=UPI002489A8A9|nr:GNAT family N-acetyltransferase [Polaromonas sp.]MDI1341197.1 GNAT family N-acetyltransferase [Polaromonas sp.]
MPLPVTFKQSPWDSAVFGVGTCEIVEPSREILELATRIPGHYTVRVDPLAPKRDLQDHGFYYCDTLIEPYCSVERFTAFDDEAVAITQDIALDPLLEICHGAFSHGRFHRDFNLDATLADQRYDNWLAQLYRSNRVYGLLYQDELAGFIAVDAGRLVLHAVAEALRGRGLAKRLWTPVCRGLFDQGHSELTSSVSAANLVVVNLYAALGFRFRQPVDIYHRLTP